MRRYTGRHLHMMQASKIRARKKAEEEAKAKAAEAKANPELEALKKKWSVDNAFEISKEEKYGAHTKHKSIGRLDIPVTKHKAVITTIFNFQANFVRTITKQDSATAVETLPFSHFDSNAAILEAHEAFKKLCQTAPNYRKKHKGPSMKVTPSKGFTK